jgi:UDP-N-acetylglucosamine 2-epimerase (non-hydrolysing)
MKKKVLIVFGTRPEAIKMAPLVKKFKECGKDFSTKVCVTAQHRQMLDDVLNTFHIKPDYDLNIMQDGQSLYHVTSEALMRTKTVFEKEKPDLVLVHGDTTTTFAAALSAFYQQIPVGHVEAGLRSYDKRRPFPEEANRLIADALCTLYFPPTTTSKKALLKENIDPKGIFVTGNTVIDALHLILENKAPFTNHVLKKVFGGVTSNELRAASRVILITAHRRENFGKPFDNAFTAIKRAAGKHPEAIFVYPVHLNPNVQEPAKRILGGTPNILLTIPLDYPDLAKLMKLSYFVITDSGGIQEEAPSLGKPVLVLRDVTERPEAVSAGTVKIVGTDEKVVFSNINRLFEDKKFYNSMARAVNPYGDGKACGRIIESIRYYFGFRRSKPQEFKI